MKSRELRLALLAALLLPNVVYAQAAKQVTREDTHVMDLAHPDYGRPNPNAPKELSQLAFLIGKWRCESRVKGPDGVYKTYRAAWVGRYVLDGYVIADEFRQWGPAGELMQLGQNYRSYNTEKKTWIIKWLDALASTWFDLGPEELGGVQVTDTSITYKHYMPPSGPAGKLFPPHTLFRLTYSNISENHFTWRAEISTDGGATWNEVQVIEAHRAKD